MEEGRVVGERRGESQEGHRHGRLCLVVDTHSKDKLVEWVLSNDPPVFGDLLDLYEIEKLSAGRSATARRQVSLNESRKRIRKRSAPGVELGC